MDMINELLANWQNILNAALLVVGAFTGFLGALYALFVLIPGEQPDKTIKAFLDFTSRISKK
jgi:hypothetical protein